MPCLHAVVGIINAYEHAKKSEKCIGKKKKTKIRRPRAAKAKRRQRGVL